MKVMSKNNSEKELGDDLKKVMTSLKTDDARDQVIKVVLTANEITEHIKSVSRETLNNKSNEKTANEVKRWTHIAIPVIISTVIAVAIRLFWG